VAYIALESPTYTGLGIVDHLRRRFARLKLSAHLLDLIGLPLEARGQGLNLPFLQSDHCRLSFSCGLQFRHNALLFEQLVCRQRRPRGGNAKLAVCSYDNRDTGDFYTRDVADKAGIAHVRPWAADANNVTGRGDTAAGANAQGCVTVAGAVNEGIDTDGSVGTAGDVQLQGL
jgi:hypothetical protein